MAASTQLSAPIALGRTSEIYDWKPGYILKLYYDWCPAHWREHEAHVAQVILAAGIPTPAVAEIVEINGRRGIVYERVQGVSMLQALNGRPWLIFKYARALADLQVQYQKLSVPGVIQYRASLENSIRRAPHLSELERGKALEWLASLPDGSALCHGDFHPGNVIVSPKGPIIIDWMTAVSGNPWADVARTSLLLTVGPRAAGKQINSFVRMFVSLYHDAYLKHYQSLQLDGQGELQRWLPVIAAARLDERIEPEREALLQMVRKAL